jgi:hypothetical protein
MRDEERRRRYDEDPDEEPEEPFEEEEEPSVEELRRLLGDVPGFEDELEEPAPYDRGRELEVRITGVYERQEPGQPRYTLVELRDNYGRRVPILIGQFEAYSIALALHGTVPQRPLTHDLMRNILDRLGARVERVVIDDLWRETFLRENFSDGAQKPRGRAGNRDRCASQRRDSHRALRFKRADLYDGGGFGGGGRERGL